MPQETEKHPVVVDKDEERRQSMETVKSKILEKISADVKVAEQNSGAYSKSNHYQYSKN